MNELISEAHRLWRSAGPLATIADFQAIEQQTVQGRPYLLIMADVAGVGRKGSMTARVHRSLFPQQSDRLEEEVRALHRDLEVALHRSPMIGVRF